MSDMRILIIEDHPTWQEGLKNILSPIAKETLKIAPHYTMALPRRWTGLQ